MEKRNKIIALILSLLMLFSNILNVFAFDFEVPIINGDEVIFDSNNNSSLIDNTVIINGSENNIVTENTTINNNSNIEENKINETKLTSKEVLEENVLTKNGRIVKSKINPIGFNENSKQLKTFTLIGRDKGADATVTFKGDEQGATPHTLIDYITRHNGDETSVGYCISPFYAGAKENGTTKVTEVKPSANDKTLIGIAVAGYPHNKYNIAGFSSLTEEEQYYATLIAMEHFIFQKTGEYKNKKGVQFNDDSFKSTRWYPNPSVDVGKQARAREIIKVAQEIYKKGVANPYDETKGIATIRFTDNGNNQGQMNETGDKYTITINIESDINYSHAVVQFTDPKIKEWANQGKIEFYDGESTTGRKLEYKTNPIAGQNYDGILLEKASRKSDKLTVVLDKVTADNAITDGTGKYNVDYDVKFFGGNMQVGYRTRNNDNSLQDYVVITTGNATARSSINWQPNFMPDVPPVAGKGGLKILKYNAKTNELVAGAIFRVRGISDGVYDFNVQIQASNGAEIPLSNGGVVVRKDGVIEISNINVGTYEITEITPPPNFDLALGQNSQTVQVENETNATLYPQVRFMNNPYGSLKIKKVDAITGEPLEGAVIKVTSPLFDYTQEFTTNAQGEIFIENLKQGDYTIQEIQAPNGYILSNETKVAVVKWREETTITYENQPKTSLQITKIDSETGEKLNGARFKLKHTTSGAEYFTDETVNGLATIENLVSGTYILTEIQAPNGYILDKTERTIVIENNRVNEITIKNSKKPSITINKVDSQTKEPLSGAKFELWRAENNTVQGLVKKVGEYYTNELGQITLNNLEYGWYAIKEIQAPQGYLLARDNIKFVFLEANQTGNNTVSITFENDKKPSLKIIKRDIKTKDLLKGAKFELWRAENNTTQGLLEKVGEYFTNDNGEIVVDIVDYGWYCIKDVDTTI